MAIKPLEFYNSLISSGLDFFAGVPDSLLKNLCACISKNAPANRHTITANEGNAVAMACGYHIATGRMGVVYLQNSGLGNAINPLLSLADEEVYSIPLLLVVGWRGEPGVHDEPQHVKQGRVTIPLLEACGIGYEVLDSNNWSTQLKTTVTHLTAESKPYAVVVRKGAFDSYPFEPEDDDFLLTREEALDLILGHIPKCDYVVSTTGKTSREVFEIREAHRKTHAHDFLTVGSMGHTASIALGMSLWTEKAVWCIDGDGSFLMHMGSLPVAASKAGSNFKYIVNVNGAHESVGGQPTIALDIDVPGILKASGFKYLADARNADEVAAGMKVLEHADGPAAMILYTRQGSRGNLGRPTLSPIENRNMIAEAFRDDS